MATADESRFVRMSADGFQSEQLLVPGPSKGDAQWTIHDYPTLLMDLKMDLHWTPLGWSKYMVPCREEQVRLNRQTVSHGQ